MPRRRWCASRCGLGRRAGSRCRRRSPRCTPRRRRTPTPTGGRASRATAFRDVNPVAPTHVLVIPRAHWANVAEVAAAAPQTLVDMIRLAAEVADVEGVTGDGYRLVANTGPAAHQTVFHAHVHVLGGRSI